MKKKVLVSFLIAALACGMCACGGNNATSTDNSATTIDVSDAKSASPSEVYDDVDANQAKAMKTLYKVTGEVDKINGDYCEIDGLYVYLPTDDLAELEKGQTIVFYGQITDVEEESYEMAGGLFTEKHIKFENAALE